MADFKMRSDSVNVEDVMRQIRARIREKRGVDYTEQEIRELAAAKLETFLDPTKVRSELLEQYRQLQRDQANPDTQLDDETLFGSSRTWLRTVRRLLRPILKLFLNPAPLARAARVDTVKHAELFFELLHNLVVETTRLGIEVKNLKMRVESLSSRLDFDERRARALEGAVQYRPAAESQAPGPPRREEEEAPEAETAGTAARARRRRRRRGRRGGQRPTSEGAAGIAEGAPEGEGDESAPEEAPPDAPVDAQRSQPGAGRPAAGVDAVARERSSEEAAARPEPAPSRERVAEHAPPGPGRDDREPGS